MKEIPLTNGGVTIVDDEDFDNLTKFKWRCVNGYAARCQNLQGVIVMFYVHREVLNLPSHLMVDHANRDKLDNRKENLRATDSTHNAGNKGMRSDNTTGFKGVSKIRNKYRATIRKYGVWRLLGHFDTPEEAHAAYCAAAKELYGEFART